MQVLNQTKRRLIRSEPNPLDKSTVVSIFPKDIFERKATLYPGEFYVKAGTYDKPSFLVVGSSSWWRSDAMSDVDLEIPNHSIQVAKSIVNDYCSALLEYNPDGAMPGLFYIPGAVSIVELKAKYKNQLDAANDRQRNWYKKLIGLADINWARSNGNPLSIDDNCRLAAQELGIKDKPWMQDFRTFEMIPCISCGNLRNTQYPVCPHCKAIVDKAKFDELKLGFAQ